MSKQTEADQKIDKAIASWSEVNRKVAKMEAALAFVKRLAADTTDACWQDRWFALKDEARLILGE